jgi:PKD repeat protein
MRRPTLLWPSLLALALATSCTDDPTAPTSPTARPHLDVSATAADPVTFCNPASISIADNARATPYPSTIDVSTGVAGNFLKITLTLNQANVPGVQGLDVLLQGPAGQTVMLMSDMGGSGRFLNSVVTFDDDALAPIPTGTNLGGITFSGTFRPSNSGTNDQMPSPAPVEPYGSTMAVFGNANPNGTWKLFVRDDMLLSGGTGTISGGWCITIKPLSSVPVANAGGPYSAIEGTPVAFDARASTDEGNDIVSYAWDFGDGTTGTGPTPAHTYALMGTYTASLRITDAEGAIDDATATVNVLNQPGTSESYCNLTPMTIFDAGRASLYPSLVAVATGIEGPFKVTVTLRGFSTALLTDLDALLVGPGGQKVMLMSDVGGASDFQNATVTFDDDATLQFATGTTVLPSGAYKPLNVGGLEAMPSPAPIEPYGSALAAFTTTSPNGTWSLYLRDDTLLGGGNSSVSGGWCVDITEVETNSPPVANAGGPYTGVEGSAITFDGRGSTDPDNNIDSYSWDFGDGSTGNGATVQHTYENGGTYTVTLTVTDANGASSSAPATATVAHVAPTATFNAPSTVVEGSGATISLTSPSSGDARYAFDCGTGYGPTGSAPSASCPISDNGTLNVRAKVIDASLDDLFTEYDPVIGVTNVAPTAVFTNNGPVSEGSTLAVSLVNVDDAPADLVGLTFAFDCGSGYGAPGASRTASCPTSDNGDMVVKAKVTDKDGGESEYRATVSVENVAPIVTSIVLPSAPVAVNAPITLSATFTDLGTGDTHTGTFELGAGGMVVPGSVSSGSLSATVSFAQAGVYTIVARVTDDDGGVGTRSSAIDVTAFVVVYDPSGSFVTGGGWISSLAGAYAADPTLSGKASFGFVSKYKPGASTPSGDTEFQFKAGALSFKSTSYEWLVVSGSQARYKGEGTVNGGGRYSFMLTAVDGDRQGGGDIDRFRLKIWDVASGAIVYDNKMGEADESDAATSLGGGSIVIHK